MCCEFFLCLFLIPWPHRKTAVRASPLPARRLVLRGFIMFQRLVVKTREDVLFFEEMCWDCTFYKYMFIMYMLSMARIPETSDCCSLSSFRRFPRNVNGLDQSIYTHLKCSSHLLSSPWKTQFLSCDCTMLYPKTVRVDRV